MERTARSLGQLLSDARNRKEIDQAEVAKRLQKSQPYISRIESGSQIPSLATAEAFARYVNADAEMARKMAIRANIARLYRYENTSLEEIREALALEL